MGDGLNLTQASIPEIDDQFAMAESRCGELQEKIDLVRMLKRNKKKLKKKRFPKNENQKLKWENAVPGKISKSSVVCSYTCGTVISTCSDCQPSPSAAPRLSLTRVNEVPLPETTPLISVRTQPKKKVLQQPSRMRRLDVPPNPTRGYLDPATVEQHRMLTQVRGYNHNYNKSPYDSQYQQENSGLYNFKGRSQQSYPDGDGMSAEASKTGSRAKILNETTAEYSDEDLLDNSPQQYNRSKRQTENYNTETKPSAKNRRNLPHEGRRDVTKWTENAADSKEGWRAVSSPVYRRRSKSTKLPQNNSMLSQKQTEERPVVELFNKNKSSVAPQLTKKQFHQANTPERRIKKQRDVQMIDSTTGPFQHDPSVAEVKKPWVPRRVKYRSRRYELPTVASQMKQTGIRYYYGTVNQTNIPFVVSKSTAPSHNIGINIQQVLNGLKIQQPVSGIPLTIAHHMGLGHIPPHNVKNPVPHPSLDNHEINAIQLGEHLLRLPSYKYMSYNRLLNLYREGDGMVSRFLRAISRPHYFYTSMFNLATNHEDLDGATSKGRGGSQEAKQSLTEYASLYREYEQIEKRLTEGNYDPQLERRKEELTKELAAREEHIRKVVQDYRTNPEPDRTSIRDAPASISNDRRRSTYKLNEVEQLQ